MPNPKLETYKNKATGTVYDYTDAAAQAALADILDGADIDSFGDVETALATKVDKVTGKGLSTNDYDNTAKGIVDNIQSNVIANTKLIKDTVGWSGKNLLPNNVVEGNYASVILTRNANGSFALNGGPASGNTASMVMATLTLPAGKYILSKSGRNDGYFQVVNEAQTQELYYAGTSDAIIELSVATTLVFRFRIIKDAVFDNAVFYPMIRPADILDPTYEPYFGSTAVDWSSYAKTGVHNVLPCNGKSTTINGLQITANDDGSYTINRTESTSVLTWFMAFDTRSISEYPLIPGEKYILSGCPSGGTTSTYYMRCDMNDVLQGRDTGEGIEFTAPAFNTRFIVYIIIAASYSPNNQVFKPMLRLATDTDPTYAPYAMTNKELTDAVTLKDVTSNITRNTDQTAYSISSLFVYKIGRLVTVIGDIGSLTENAVPSGRSFITIATGLPKALKNSNIFAMPIGSGNQTQVYVEGNSSDMKMRGGTTGQSYQFVFTYISAS